jgi:hypothetical protein
MSGAGGFPSSRSRSSGTSPSRNWQRIPLARVQLFSILANSGSATGTLAEWLEVYQQATGYGSLDGPSARVLGGGG